MASSSSSGNHSSFHQQLNQFLQTVSTQKDVEQSIEALQMIGKMLKYQEITNKINQLRFGQILVSEERFIGYDTSKIIEDESMLLFQIIQDSDKVLSIADKPMKADQFKNGKSQQPIWFQHCEVLFAAPLKPSLPDQIGREQLRLSWNGDCNNPLWLSETSHKVWIYYPSFKAFTTPGIYHFDQDNQVRGIFVDDDLSVFDFDIPSHTPLFSKGEIDLKSFLNHAQQRVIFLDYFGDLILSSKRQRKD